MKQSKTQMLLGIGARLMLSCFTISVGQADMVGVSLDGFDLPSVVTSVASRPVNLTHCTETGFDTTKASYNLNHWTALSKSSLVIGESCATMQDFNPVAFVSTVLEIVPESLPCSMIGHSTPSTSNTGVKKRPGVSADTPTSSRQQS